jgi:hypothetical protein
VLHQKSTGRISSDSTKDVVWDELAGLVRPDVVPVTVSREELVAVTSQHDDSDTLATGHREESLLQRPRHRRQAGPTVKIPGELSRWSLPTKTGGGSKVFDSLRPQSRREDGRVGGPVQEEDVGGFGESDCPCPLNAARDTAVGGWNVTRLSPVELLDRQDE